MPITHAFVSGKADDADATLVRPVNWNQNHVVNVDLTSEVTGILPAANGGANTIKSITQTAHGFAVGDCIRLNGTSYTKAQGDSSANAEFVGIVSAVTSANVFVLTQLGYISGLSGLTAGVGYFLSPTTAGTMTATQPSTAGQVSKFIFLADTTTSGYVVSHPGFTITTSTPTSVLSGRKSTQTSAVATGTTLTPADDTIPQSSEGTEFMTLSYTASSTSNVLTIEVLAMVSNSAVASNPITIALFKDSDTDALASQTIMSTGNGLVMQASLRHIMNAPSTSAVTYKVRIGANALGTTTFNGSGGTRRYGGTAASSITILETTL